MGLSSLAYGASFDTTTEEPRNECRIGTKQVVEQKRGGRKRKLETAGAELKLAPAPTLR